MEHLRNRFAMVLAVLFIPGWTSLVYRIVSERDVTFLLRASGEWVTAPGDRLSFLPAALNTVTAIIGFMMFTVTFRSSRFDQRLTMAGYPRGALIAAKLTALLVVAALICAYTTALICLHWTPKQPIALWLSLFCAAMAYGGIGVMLGAVLRGELEGMFSMIMISIVDTTLQSPFVNPAGDNDLIRYLPSYGTMQSGMSAAFLSSSPLPHLLLEALWFIGAITAAGVAFKINTRDRSGARVGPVRTRFGTTAGDRTRRA
nr:ABC transporter permease [Planomonospora venezuelensis]